MEKLQAASAKLSKPQATSLKSQAARFKLQAASYKLQDPVSLIKFQATRIVDLDYDKTILGMPHMEADLVWWEANFVCLCNFQLDRKEMIIFIISQ